MLPEERLKKQEEEASKQRVYVQGSDGKEVSVGAPQAVYVCLGEIIQTKGWTISPSAQAVFPKYLEEALAIVGTNERGEHAWRTPAREMDLKDLNKALVGLDSKRDYLSLWLELLLFEDEILSARHNTPRYLARGDDGEIHATEEGFTLCKERVLSALEEAKKALAEGPPAWSSQEQFPEDLFFSVLRAGRPLLDGAGLNTLSRKQREAFVGVIETVSKALQAKITRLPRGYFLDSQWMPGALSETEGLDIEEGWAEATDLLDSLDGIPFASGGIVQQLLPTMYVREKWRESDEGWVYAKAPDSLATKNITYFIGGEAERGVPRLPGEEAWAIVKDLGLETAFLHIQFAGYCMSDKLPCGGYIRGNTDNLLDMLGLKDKRRLRHDGKRGRLTRPEQLNELKKSLEALRTIHIMVDGKDRNGNRWVSTSPEPLWDILIREQKPASLFSGTFEAKGLETRDLAVYVRAGNWAMAETGNKGRLLYSHLSKSVTKFNPYQEDWALKWAIYLACYRKERVNTFKIRTLLEIVLPEEEIHKLEDPTFDRRKRNGYATKLQDQLMAMEEKGWTIGRNTDYLRANPGGKRRPKNFMNLLLDSSVRITPPPITQRNTYLSEGDLPLLPVKEETGITGPRIREARRRSGMTQKELARAIGKSRGLVQLIEAGSRAITSEVLKALQKVLKL